MAFHVSYVAGTSYYPADMLQREADWVYPGRSSTLDLVITPGSGLSIDVSGAPQGTVGGNAWFSGGYRFYNDTALNLTLATANGVYSRLDAVYAGMNTNVTPPVPAIIVVTGVPSGSPVVPTCPVGYLCIQIGVVTVTANAGSIISGNINQTTAPIATLQSPSFSSTIPTGTSPITVVSTTQVQNLNASLLGGVALSNIAQLSSPNFSGVPTVPTAALNTNSTQAASTGFVLGQLATVAPAMDGAAAVGTATTAARQDHIHPSDSLAVNALPKSGGTLTGITTAQPNTSYTVAQLHNVILSTADAVLGSMNNGDIWIKYV